MRAPPPTLDTLFFFNDTATTEIYTLSLHDALPISHGQLVAAPLRAQTGRDDHGHLPRLVGTRPAGHYVQLLQPAPLAFLTGPGGELHTRWGSPYAVRCERRHRWVAGGPIIPASRRNA